MFHFWSQVAWAYWQIKSVLRLHGPIWTVILCSGCMDLYDCHFVLRSHRPTWSALWSAFCTQVTWTCFACVNSQHRGTLDSDSYFANCAQATWTYTFTNLHSGHTGLSDCHFVLRLHGPIWSAFCTQVGQTYDLHLNITMLPSAIPLAIHPHNLHMILSTPFYKMCDITSTDIRYIYIYIYIYILYIYIYICILRFNPW